MEIECSTNEDDTQRQENPPTAENMDIIGCHQSGATGFKTSTRGDAGNNQVVKKEYEVDKTTDSITLEKLLQCHWRRAVEYLCNNCFDFTDCVSVCGNLIFINDENQIVKLNVKEEVQKNKSQVRIGFGELSKEELGYLAEKSTSVVKLLNLPTKSESLITGENIELDLDDGDEKEFENPNNDPNDDDYIPSENLKTNKRLPNLKRKTKRRKAKKPKALQPKGEFKCNHCSYTARFFGHFIKHYENRHQYQPEDIVDLEEKFNQPPVKETENTTENIEKLNEISEKNDDDSNMNVTGTAKRDRKRIHICDREGCDYATDHIGHYRDHLNRHDGLRPFKCKHCPKNFVRHDDLKRHEERHQRKFECPKCSEKFESRLKLKEHAKTEHDFDGRIVVFSCSVCKSTFSTKDELEKHTLVKHNHVCSICGESFSIKRNLAKHRMAQHKEEMLKCQICGKSMPTTTALRKHVARHDAEGSQFPCDICGKTFTAASTLYHHKRGVHTEEKPYKCKQCGQGFNFHHSMKLHILRHKGLRPHKCTLCDKSYLTATHLRGHMDAVHSTKKRFNCPICDKKFPYENSLKMHMMLHTNDRPFVCHLCGRGFVSSNALKNHEGTHVEGKNFECNECHKKYKTEQLLRAHTRRHTNDGSRFMCDLCGNTFMYRSNLDAHMAVHGEQRNYTCPDCGKCFKTAATLYSHKLVHKEETPFTCNICTKGFKSKERLAQHQHRHSGLKPFVCDRCGHAFPDKGGLSKHRKTVHAIMKKFSCPVCSKACARADNLRVHMKIHGDPSLLTLPMEKLLAPGYDESAEESMRASVLLNINTVPTTSQDETSSIKNFSQNIKHTEENKGAKVVDPTTTSLAGGVDNVSNMSHNQVVNLQPVAVAPQSANVLPQPQQAVSGVQTLAVPVTSYQLVTASNGETTYIPPPVQEQSRYANMETISASAMMLMSTNYFQTLNNTQQ